MRRFLLIVAMLLIVAGPAMATVTIGAKHTRSSSDCRTVEVNYIATGGDRVRAFALEVTVDSNFYIAGIDANVGESNKAGSGSGKPCFGIFPGKFRDWIDPANPNWVDPNYNPVAPATDTDAAGTGIGTKKIIVEMGSLFVGDSNRPPSSGVLFKIRVDPNKFGVAECNLNIALNNTRGGVIDENGTALTPTLPTTNTVKVSFLDCFPCWAPYDVQYSQWVAVWKPNCWCGQYAVADANWRTQCKGDADGKGETLSKFRVFNSDYQRLTASWGLKATVLKNNPNPKITLCADFDHKGETLSSFRVFNSDYAKMVANWGLAETKMKPWCPTP